jgi:pimeloyl-ACP methyl ester carboxylesterase
LTLIGVGLRYTPKMDVQATHTSGTVDVDGLPIFYEALGDGTPIMLLHGGMGTNALWSEQFTGLSPHRRIIAPERRGHGHTPDRDGPLTYHGMAGETVGFLQTVGLGPIDMVGWSDGGMVAFLVAVHHPELVRTLTLLGCGYSSDGYVPGALEELLTAEAHDESLATLAALYCAVSPDGPEHLAVAWDKVRTLWAEPFDWSGDLAKVQAPTLVVVGDDDFISVPHANGFAQALAHGQLAVIPGTSHASPIEKPDLFNRLVLDFTDQPLVTETLMPVRRRAN